MPDHDPLAKADYSFAVQVREKLEVTFSTAQTWTWDTYCRLIYNKFADGIARQANMLLERGNVTRAEVEYLVEGQRNAFLKTTRNRLTPFGRYYSELLKPSTNLPTVDSLLQKKGSLEAILRSVGKTRASVNRMAMFVKYAGPGMITIEIVLTAVVIKLAPKEEQAREAAKLGSGVAGAAGGTMLGAWAGCATFAAFASPSLVVPIVGEVSTAGACMVGGLIGGAGGGMAGRWIGERIGAAAHDWVTTWEWVDSVSPASATAKSAW